MPILKRDDGLQFAIHAYRELLEPAKLSYLKNEIRNLAQSHGEYVRLFQQPHGQIEAVFSRDPGFLLGEAVWQYFGKPTDLVYCEALPDGHYAIVVIVRGGSVYLDSKIPFNNIPDEFTSLVAGNIQYDIYLYGDVPISETLEVGKFVFDPSNIKSFTQLDKPVFKNLQVDDSLQLQPLEFALRAQKVGKRYNSLIILFFIGLLLATGIWYHFFHRQTPPPQAVVTPQPQAPVDPYQGYKAALMTPAPEKQFDEIAATIALAFGIPGWQPTKVTFRNTKYTIQLSSLGGSVIVLNQWAKEHSVNMSLSAQGAFLSLRSHLNNRAVPSTISRLQQVIDVVIDRIDKVTPQHSIMLGNATATGSYKTMSITLQFNGISPGVLTLIGRQFAQLPAQLNSAQINISNGILSGTAQLTVLGN